MNQIWTTINENLKMQLSEPNYQIFINSTEMKSFEDNILSLKVNNNYAKSWIKDKCEPLIKSTLSNDGTEIIINIEVEEDIQEEAPQLQLFQTPPTQTQTQKPNQELRLNKNFTFDSFVVGNNNRFAHAAALAVANKPAKAYNPLFLYGNVGLGKTHLLYAIAHQIHENTPDSHIQIVTSEKFTNELINALKNKQSKTFKEKYRNTDVLIIDDIQFLAGKEATQEEFFHTFNELHGNSKQIILTSDRPPSEIPTLQDRLRTRFAWGLVADIQAPELETRIAILRKKNEDQPVIISDQILHYIATQIPSNIRELEGALNRLTAYASLMNTEITLSVASNIIKDMVGNAMERPLTADLIKRKVAEFFNIPEDGLTGKLRTKDLAHARQVAMYLTRELTNMSLPKIGENFGKRDHSTVMHACDKIKQMLTTNNENITTTINTLISLIKAQ